MQNKGTEFQCTVTQYIRRTRSISLKGQIPPHCLSARTLGWEQNVGIHDIIDITYLQRSYHFL